MKCFKAICTHTTKNTRVTTCFQGEFGSRSFDRRIPRAREQLVPPWRLRLFDEFACTQFYMPLFDSSTHLKYTEVPAKAHVRTFILWCET